MNIHHPCPWCGTFSPAPCPECLAQLRAEHRAMEIERQIEQSRDGVCAVCGCTPERACPGGCVWIEPDLCSRCAEGIDAA